MSFAAHPGSSAALARLECLIRPHGSMIVAFSGGVDSAVLAAAARRALGDRAVALTADSPSLPREELATAREIASRIGIRHLVPRTDELNLPEYVKNDVNRCFFCKETLFTVAEKSARALGITAIAYGYTADDVHDYRPGHASASRRGILAPLADAGLGKSAIREIAHLLELPVWDKPAAPCLSSRIPYGNEVTVERLAAIESVERWLHARGFAVCRARYDGTLMRIEVETGAIERLRKMLPELERVSLAAGAQRVTIDEEGFATGKLNRTNWTDGSQIAHR